MDEWETGEFSKREFKTSIYEPIYMTYLTELLAVEATDRNTTDAMAKDLWNDCM